MVSGATIIADFKQRLKHQISELLTIRYTSWKRLQDLLFLRSSSVHWPSILDLDLLSYSIS